ncbi:hypothetical protein RHGRI_012073 [Rhododendron griersonianum]|uniref:Uncharacterized protein n=1 Tax=Rhododendron griersonianum TaxID=479676 RepID=A0AAV6KQ95_9ERIC|nr:hypothetical protein RHGRI_012073 [Rhododendron griersonianum]
MAQCRVDQQRLLLELQAEAAHQPIDSHGGFGGHPFGLAEVCENNVSIYEMLPGYLVLVSREVLDSTNKTLSSL